MEIFPCEWDNNFNLYSVPIDCSNKFHVWTKCHNRYIISLPQIIFVVMENLTSVQWKRSPQNFTNILGFFGFISMCFFQTKNFYFSLFFRYDDVEAKSPATHWRDPGLSSAARLDNQDQSGWQAYFQPVMAHRCLRLCWYGRTLPCFPIFSTFVQTFADVMAMTTSAVKYLSFLVVFI